VSDRATATPSLDTCERLFAAVELWREIHRVLVAGGGIVLTTPNCYALTRRHLRRARAWVGGGGIGVDEILATPTHGHHRKEYLRGGSSSAASACCRRTSKSAARCTSKSSSRANRAA